MDSGEARTDAFGDKAGGAVWQRTGEAIQPEGELHFRMAAFTGDRFPRQADWPRLTL
jgi:hypothetical protein